MAEYIFIAVLILFVLTVVTVGKSNNRTSFLDLTQTDPENPEEVNFKLAEAIQEVHPFYSFDKCYQLAVDNKGKFKKFRPYSEYGIRKVLGTN